MSLKLAPTTAESEPIEEVVLKLIVILFVASDVEGLFAELVTPDSEVPLIR